MNYNSDVYEQYKQLYEKTSLNLDKQVHLMTGPLHMSIDITNKCMLNCLHCFNRSGVLNRNEMCEKEMLKATDQLISLKPQQACICGGEPLIKKKLLFKMINRMHENNIFSSFVSNGILLNEKVANEIAKLGDVNIQISLDGFKPEQHDKLRNFNGAFEKAVQAIKNLINIGIQPSTAWTPNKFNIDSFPEHVEFAKSLGVKEIRVQPIMPLGSALLNIESIIPTEEQYRNLVRFIRMYSYEKIVLKDKNSGMINYVSSHNPSFSIQWGDCIDHIIRFSQVLVKPTVSFGIYSNGDIFVSPYIPLVFGNVNKHSLKEYWEAGMNRIWEYPIMQKYSSCIRSENDMPNIRPLLFYKENLMVDIIENSYEHIEEISNKVFKTLNN